MEKDKMWVITGESITTRGSGAKQLEVKELAINVNLFLEQMGGVLEKAPEKLGKFHFEEFEVHAEITAQGKIAILGTGVQAGATGGLKFVFRRSPVSGNEE